MTFAVVLSGATRIPRPLSGCLSARLSDFYGAKPAVCFLGLTSLTP
jgi:hypothetical protein